MINRFRVSSLLPIRLEELGVSPLVVLRQAGLPMGLFNQEKVFITTGELFDLYRGIAEVSRDPAIGLNASFAEHLPPSGRIAVASQSGGLGLAVINLAVLQKFDPPGVCARSLSERTSSATSANVRRSAWRTTGTSSPSVVATAKPT